MSELCRICMHKKQEMFPLIKINSKSLERRGEKFEDCFNLKIMAVPYLHICKQCDLQLIELYYFKQLALRTHNYLLDKTNLEGNDFKQEPPDHENATSFKEEDTTNEFYNIEYLEEEATNVDENMDEIVGEDNEALIGNSDDYVDDEYCTEYASFLVSFVEDSQTEGTLESAENDDKQANDETPGQLHPENTIKRKHRNLYKNPKKFSNRKRITTQEINKNKQRLQFKHTCEECGKRFFHDFSYEAHLNIHKGLPPFKCNICYKGFKQKINFDYHMKNHYGVRNFKCSLCDKAFLIQWDLDLHMRSHNDARPFICDICGKGFRISVHLSSHQETHISTNTFECPYCELKLHTQITLKRHIASVHKLGNLKNCPFCEKQFFRMDRLKRHLANNHESVDVQIVKQESTADLAGTVTQANESTNDL